MRVARVSKNGRETYAFLTATDAVVLLDKAAAQAGVSLPEVGSILDLLPGGRLREQVREIESAVGGSLASLEEPAGEWKLLVPVPAPGKLILLAGNYAKHVEEGGGRAAEREKTFPYLFMKPPATTLTHPGDPIRIPTISPNEIDWEAELAVVIGRECSQVSEADALQYIAGYTIVNDISDRAFHPNPQRTQRPKDGFFDWQHGKWHDTFCPMGPAILPAEECPDPQNLAIQLTVNGEIEQDGNTSEMIFPVAAIIEFISGFVTLSPGDILSTGTTDGVGKAKGKFLKHGDQVDVKIEKIGVLSNPVV